MKVRKGIVKANKKFIFSQANYLFQHSTLSMSEKKEIYNRFLHMLEDITNIDTLNSITDKIYDEEQQVDGCLLLLEVMKSQVK